MQINKPKLLGLTFIHIMLILAGLGVTSAFGQTYQKEALTWGIKAGVTVSDLYGDAVENSEVNTGFSGGLFLNYRFNDYWALQPEVIYSEKGAELNPGLTGEGGPANYEFGYLDIPVLVKFYIPTGAIVTPNIYAGPQVGFKLYGDSNDNEIDDELKDAEFAVTFGAGLDFNAGSSPADFIRTVGLDLRYSLGLTKVFDTPQEPEARNGAFLAALFIEF